MYQKDYLLFMIEQFGRVLQKIAAQISGGAYDDASYEIEQIYRQYLGVNSGLINSFSFEGLMMLQSADPDQYLDRSITLAQMLRLEGDIFAKHSAFADARGRYTKSLAIYLTVFLDPRADGRFAEQRSSVTELQTLLSAGDLRTKLPEQIRDLIQQHAERQ